MPEHIREIAVPVLRHRIILNFNAEADGMTSYRVVNELLEKIPVEGTDPAVARGMEQVIR
jgi:MoxR-like ATPase